MDKKLYITTAIPYVNSTPHVGNAIDYLCADIWARYQRQNGHEVRFSVGTDEHGNKIAAKAAELGLDPKTFTDKMSANFAQLMQKMDTTYTDFVRTTDEHHMAAVQYIWKVLKPYIYKSSYEGWYCVGCESFITDKEASENNGVCPDHNQPYQRIKEDNYYLKTSAFTDQIREAIVSNEMQIYPEFRKKEFLELIKDGLQDVSISRPKKDLSWGIPVPDDPEQIMYVWIDALANYITVIGYPDNDKWKQYWPAEVQVIGKDILRFHAGIWPAMLLGLGLPLPKKLLVHGHVHSAGQKISKTLGNVVDPVQVIDEYGLDAFRYFFSRHIPTLDDGDFTWEAFENSYNTELANDLGNVISRIGGMITRYQAGVVGEVPQGEHDMDTYHHAMENLEFDKAIDEIWLMIKSLNQYIENVKPWEIAKQAKTDPEAVLHLSEVLNNSVGSLTQIADLLVPFLPATAEKIHTTFKTGAVVSLDGVLFPRIYKHTVDPNAPKA
jgi:methionyl-tRNA synthetase